MSLRYLLTLSLLALPTHSLLAQKDLPADQLEFFEEHIRPALADYCFECHSEESGKTRGGLLLDTHEGIRQGGDSGDTLGLDDLSDSLLLLAITWDYEDYEMPPKTKMPQEVIDKFKTWLEMGAPDPRLREKLFVDSEVDIEAGKEHWAFQKPVRPKEKDIDTFVSAKLKEAKLTPVPEADSLTLLRRLNFDLIGLPPTPGEARVFHTTYQKNAEAAIESKVNELLARSQFGERWGRHWLDVSRYAESSGEPNFTFPHAWRYRDYVIDSYNQDKPYDQFIKEQIAGDLLPYQSETQRQEQLIATGFLALGNKGLNDRNPRTFMMDQVDEQIDTVSKSILGVTAACARCHDHKFDPIPTTDYYALAGIFMSTETLYGTIPGLQNHRPAELMVLPRNGGPQIGLSFTAEEIEGMKKSIADTEQQMLDIRTNARKTGDRPEQRQMVQMRNRISLTQGKLDSLDENGNTQNYAMGVREAEEIANAHVLVRGDVEKSAQEVDRGFLQVLSEGDPVTIGSGSSGRLELADWLTSTNNPLTARVMVNRIWMHLLGEPLVASLNNWGLTGQAATHPGLLDYLAIRFMESGWSTKDLIREIVLTDTYQRSSTYHKDNYEADPGNSNLWRANSRQLDAEALRDSMLAVAGKLDTSRPVGSPVSEVGDARVGRQIDALSFYNMKYRSVYLPVIRNAVAEPLALFDFVNPAESVARRTETNVSSQALFLMNNNFVTDAARNMAQFLWERFDDDDDQRVTSAFLLAYGRMPAPEDLAATKAFFDNYDFEPVGEDASTDRPFQRRPGRASAEGMPGRGPMAGGKGSGKGKGKGKGVSVEAPSTASYEAVKPLPKEQETLAMFCQALISSAEFRILN